MTTRKAIDDLQEQVAIRWLDTRVDYGLPPVHRYRLADEMMQALAGLIGPEPVEEVMARAGVVDPGTLDEAALSWMVATGPEPRPVDYSAYLLSGGLLWRAEALVRMILDDDDPRLMVNWIGGAVAARVPCPFEGHDHRECHLVRIEALWNVLWEHGLHPDEESDTYVAGYLCANHRDTALATLPLFW